MTIVQYRYNARKRGHSLKPATIVWPQLPPARRPVGKRPERTGDFERRGKLPLTPLQRATLLALSDEPQGPKALAAAAGLTDLQAGSAVRYLSAKNLAARGRGGKGWVRVPCSGWRRA